MAGRGVWLNIQLHLAAGEHKDIALSCALHAPLSIFRKQLQNLTKIPASDQTLILRHEEDDNQDLLLGREWDTRTLRECGVTEGCRLSLADVSGRVGGQRTQSRGEAASTSGTRHAQGLKQQRDKFHEDEEEDEEYDEKEEEDDEEEEDEDEEFEECGEYAALRGTLVAPEVVSRDLSTPIQPDTANHCYNGIIFDIRAKEPHEVEVRSVWVGGMLGRVRVFTRFCSWAGTGGEDSCRTQSFWGHQYSINTTGWVKIADVKTCSPSWDKPYEIKLDSSIRLLPGQKRGVYIHSDLPNDLGIQYHSFPTNRPFAEDEHVSLHPGLGHTSSEPFDRENGWYRGLRGMAGVVSYTAQLKLWTPDSHWEFPILDRTAMQTMLMCHSEKAGLLHKLPLDIVLRILEFCHWNWFEQEVPAVEEEPQEEEEPYSDALRMFRLRNFHDILQRGARVPVYFEEAGEDYEDEDEDEDFEGYSSEDAQEEVFVHGSP